MLAIQVEIILFLVGGNDGVSGDILGVAPVDRGG